MATTNPRVPAGLRLPDLTAADLTIVPANEASWGRTHGASPRSRGARSAYDARRAATSRAHRRRAASSPAAVDFARERGARAVEADPMIAEPGVEITWGETHVGTRSIFEAAWMTEVLRASLRRVVMRIDFAPRVCPADPQPSTKMQRRRR